MYSKSDAHFLQVRALARKHFGCDSIVGFPLEDLPLGAGVHWEASDEATTGGFGSFLAPSPSSKYLRVYFSPSCKISRSLPLFRLAWPVLN